MEKGNVRQGETYDQFIVRQKAEAAGKPVPKPAMPSVLGDPGRCIHVTDAIDKALGRK
jgi:hypothetical protein